MTAAMTAEIVRERWRMGVEARALLLITAILLVLGLATRLTAVNALFMNVNFLMMNGLTLGGAVDALFVVLEIVLIAYAARQALSADGALAKRGFARPWMSGAITASG